METPKSILCFYFAVNFLKLINACEVTPLNTKEIKVSLFYNLDVTKLDSTHQAITNACEGLKVFGTQMTVEFIVIGGGQNDSGSQEDATLELTIICAMMSASDPTQLICCSAKKDIEDCAKDNNIDWKPVAACVALGNNSDAGKQLTANREALDKAGLGSEGDLPAMIFNDKAYNKCNDNSAYDAFVSTMCRLYGEFAPSNC